MSESDAKISGELSRMCRDWVPLAGSARMIFQFVSCFCALGRRSGTIVSEYSNMLMPSPQLLALPAALACPPRLVKMLVRDDSGDNDASSAL